MLAKIICFAFLILQLANLALCKDYLTVAVLSEPYPEQNGDNSGSWIMATVVRWLEAEGAVTVPIQPWYSEEKIDDILNKVSGVVFQGGERDLDLNKDYEKVADYIVRKVKAYNEVNGTLPLIALCQGFQLIHAIVMDTV